jgi:hypothetical protein
MKDVMNGSRSTQELRKTKATQDSDSAIWKVKITWES